MDLDFRPARVTTTFLRRDGTTGRASHTVWADNLRDAKRHARAQLPGRLVSVRATWEA